MQKFLLFFIDLDQHHTKHILNLDLRLAKALFVNLLIAQANSWKE